MTVIDWLLDSDPAIRWQVLRDLADAPADVVAAERARIAIEGWGARLLDVEDEDGQWDGGALFPARRDPSQGVSQFGEGQPWSATAYSLRSAVEQAVIAAALSVTSRGARTPGLEHERHFGGSDRA
jgi:hypothetical protein